ncbi:MAG: hypothetical protein KGP35_09615, partial [Bacteroidetes bacterium]|nr:hypothetical protein [Bacteroidota bacterium]
MIKKVLSLFVCLLLMVAVLNAQVTSKSILDAGCPDPNYDTYPFLECYQTATWNASTCQWDVTGTQPAQPGTLGYFESFSTTWLPSGAQANTLAGTVDMQNGWTTRDAYTTSTTVGRWDQQVIQVNDANGNRKVLRMSNAITSPTYPSQVFSAVSGQVAGETGSSLWNNRGTNGLAPLSPTQFGANATSKTFYTKLKFRSATGAAQTGLQLTLSPSAKQSAVRMSFLQIQDNGSTGFNLNFYETLANGAFPSNATQIASGLSYTTLHTLEMEINFVDGVSTVGGVVFGNDVVKIWLNGTLIHTGTTWESYYYTNSGERNSVTSGPGPRLQAVNSMLFRVSTPSAPATSNNGFYFEDFAISNESRRELACYESYTFNTTTCSWEITGTQPEAPTGLACYQTATFNTETCKWDTTGTQPEQPTGLECYQTATFNTTTCSWDVTGTQPAAPTGLECYQTATFNTTTCSWDVTGTQPEAPTGLECYQTATFNTTTCSWDVTGTPVTLPVPQISATNVVTDVCGGRKVRYSVTLPTVAGGTVVPEWDFVGTVLGANAVIDSGGFNTAKIVVLYSSNLASVQSDSVRVRFNYNNGCSFSAYALRRINLPSFNAPPTAVTSLTQQLVSNVCGARVYRYIALGGFHATGFEWTLPVSVGGVSGVTIDSGDIATSKVIRVRYASNAAAIDGDSIRVRAYNLCHTAEGRSFRLTNRALLPTVTPLIRSTNVVTNVCEGRRVRYSVTLPTVSAVTVAAEWSFVGGVLGANAVIDSGDVTSSTIVVKYSSNLASVQSDSVRVRFSYDNGCAFSSYGRTRIALTSFNPPVTEVTSISQQLVSNVCGERVYRYIAWGGVHATGYSWTLPSTLGGGASGAAVDSGDAATSKVIRVRYASNAAAIDGDSIRVRAYNVCYSAATRSYRLTNGSWSALAPSGITTTDLTTDACGARKVRYSVGAPNIAALGAAVIEWSFAGSVLGANAVIDSGEVNSSTIVVLYTSNLGAAEDDSVRVRYNYNNGCTFSSYALTKIQLNAFNPPLAPLQVRTTNVVTNVCGGRRVRYAIELSDPNASFTALEWRLSGSVLGSNGVIDSGGVNASTIVVLYNSNFGAAQDDSIRVSYTYNNGCTYSDSAHAKITLGAFNPPPTPVTSVSQVLLLNSNGVRVYRYTANGASNATRFAWTLPTSLGGVSGVTLDSGNLAVSRVIRVRYASNVAALLTDSIRVRAHNICFSGEERSFRLWREISVQNLVTNVCGARRVRYSVASRIGSSSGDNLPVLSSGLRARVEWNFVGDVLGASAVIDSGDINSSTIVVLFTSNRAAAANDSVRVRYVYDNGTTATAYSGMGINLGALGTPPGIVPNLSQQLVSNICGERVYRYTAWWAPNATSYEWSLPVSVGGVSGVTLDSGDIATSKVIRVRYASNAAAIDGDSIRVRGNNACYVGAQRAFRLTNRALLGCENQTPPARRANPELITFGAKVYPNPSRGAFNVQLTGSGSEEVELRITDIQGRSI